MSRSAERAKSRSSESRSSQSSESGSRTKSKVVTTEQLAPPVASRSRPRAASASRAESPPLTVSPRRVIASRIANIPAARSETNLSRGAYQVATLQSMIYNILAPNQKEFVREYNLPVIQEAKVANYAQRFYNKHLMIKAQKTLQAALLDTSFKPLHVNNDKNALHFQLDPRLMHLLPKHDSNWKAICSYGKGVIILYNPDTKCFVEIVKGQVEARRLGYRNNDVYNYIDSSDLRYFSGKSVAIFKHKDKLIIKISDKIKPVVLTLSSTVCAGRAEILDAVILEDLGVVRMSSRH